MPLVINGQKLPNFSKEKEDQKKILSKKEKNTMDLKNALDFIENLEENPTPTEKSINSSEQLINYVSAQKENKGREYLNKIPKKHESKLSLNAYYFLAGLIKVSLGISIIYILSNLLVTKVLNLYFNPLYAILPCFLYIIEIYKITKFKTENAPNF